MFFSNIFKIWKKELKSYFYTPLAYVFIGTFSFVTGTMFLLFLRAYRAYEQEVMMGRAESITIDKFAEAFYGNMNMILLFIIPFFTMGLFTDELRKNTLVLLLTSPIRNWEIVLGKFCAALSILFTMLLLTGVFPLFLSLYSQGGPANGPDPGVIFTTYLGLFLVGALYVSVGLFWSSIATSSLIAVVLTFANLFGFWLVSFAAQSSSGVMKTALSQVAVIEQFSALLSGSLELKTVVFFTSIIGLALYLTKRAVESYSWRA